MAVKNRMRSTLGFKIAHDVRAKTVMEKIFSAVGQPLEKFMGEAFFVCKFVQNHMVIG